MFDGDKTNEIDSVSDFSINSLTYSDIMACFSPCSIFYCISGVFCGLWGNKGKKMSNFNYFTIYLIAVVCCLIIEYLPSDNHIVDINFDKLFKRHGIEIVYRISYAMVASFGVMFLCTLCWPFLHHMFLLIFLVIFGGFAYLFVWGINDNAFISGFRNVARAASFFYLILQAISLVDMSFSLHEWLVKKIDETNERYSYTDKNCCCVNQYKSFYLTLSFFFLILSISSCIIFYFYFRVNGRLCGINITEISLTLLLGIGCCCISMNEKINRGFIAPTTFFVIMVFYLLLSLLANPNTKCNPHKTYSNYWITGLNVLMVIVSGYWISYRLCSYKEKKEDVEELAGEENKTVMIKIPEEDGFEPAIFHFCMILTSFYLAMLCSAWYNGDYTIRPTSIHNYTNVFTSWVFSLSIVVGGILFLYVLIIPLLNEKRSY